MANLHIFTKNAHPEQWPHSAASDLGRHCFPVTTFGVSRLQSVSTFWVMSEVIEVFALFSRILLLQEPKHSPFQQVKLALLSLFIYNNIVYEAVYT